MELPQRRKGGAYTLQILAFLSLFLYSTHPHSLLTLPPLEFLKKIYLFLCIWLFAYKYECVPCVHLVPVEVKDPAELELRWLWVIMCVLGIEPGRLQAQLVLLKAELSPAPFSICHAQRPSDISREISLSTVWKYSTMHFFLSSFV